MNLTRTKRVLSEALSGRLPDEASVRSARAEIDAAERAPAGMEVVSPPAEEHPDGPVTTAEATLALGEMFCSLESTLMTLRADGRFRVAISNEVADAFIQAKAILKKAGHETVGRRKVDPIKIVPLLTRPPARKP